MGEEEGEGGAHSRGRPQDEHPDGPPLFVRVLGTSLRPGGTQGGVIHSPREAGLLGLLGTRSAANQSSGRWGGARPVTDRVHQEIKVFRGLRLNLETSQSLTDPNQIISPPPAGRSSRLCTRA